MIDRTTIVIRAIGMLFNFIYKMGYEQGVADATHKFIEDTRKALHGKKL